MHALQHTQVCASNRSHSHAYIHIYVFRHACALHTCIHVPIYTCRQSCKRTLAIQPNLSPTRRTSLTRSLPPAEIHDMLSLGMLIEAPAEPGLGVLKEIVFMAHHLGLTVNFTPISSPDYERWVAEQTKQRFTVSRMSHVHTYACARAHACAHTYTHTYAHTHIRTHADAYQYITRTKAHTHTQINMHTHFRTHVHTHTLTRSHTYIHTLSLSLSFSFSLSLSLSHTHTLSM